MKIRLDEASRKDLINKNMQSQKGKLKYKRRNKSSIKKNVNNFNEINMNDLFKKGVFEVNIPVRGETNNYIVKIKSIGFLDELHKQMKSYGGIFNNKTILKTLQSCFDRNDLFVHCSCPDTKYRYAYWSTQHHFNSGEPQNSNGKKIRNPNDTLGAGCKHTMLVLSNNSWLIPCTSVIYNYCLYMKKNKFQTYCDIIFPAIYEKDYDDYVQTDLFNDDELAKIDKGNDDVKLGNIHQGRDDGGKFVKGNQIGYRYDKEPSNNDNQYSLFNDEEEK